MCRFLSGADTGMPASSADGLGNVVAALESNFKQQQRRLINSETFVSDNSTSADKEDESVTDSWIDQILGNEVCVSKCIM